MEKRSHKELFGHWQKLRMPRNGFVEFAVGFVAALALCMLLASVFREQIYQFVVNLSGG